MGLPAPVAKTSEIEWDGKGNFTLQTGRLVFGTTLQTAYLGVAPCDGELIWAQVRSLASAIGASAKFNLGRNANASAILPYYTFTGQTASTVVNLMAATGFVDRKVSKGDVITMNVKKVSAANQGSFAGVLVFRPRGN